MTEKRIKITQDIEGDVSVKEVDFYTYMTAVRGMLAIFVQTATSFTNLIDTRNLSDVDKKNFATDQEQFLKICKRASAFNQFMESYEGLRKAAYMITGNNNQKIEK